MDAPANAFIDTGWLFPSINPVIAEMTFFSHAFNGIELHHSKRTGLEAGLTAVANLWINENDSVGPLVDGVNRARIFTWGF